MNNTNKRMLIMFEQCVNITCKLHFKHVTQNKKLKRMPFEYSLNIGTVSSCLVLFLVAWSKLMCEVTSNNRVRWKKATIARRRENIDLANANALQAR